MRIEPAGHHGPDHVCEQQAVAEVQGGVERVVRRSPVPRAEDDVLGAGAVVEHGVELREVAGSGVPLDPEQFGERGCAGRPSLQVSQCLNGVGGVAVPTQQGRLVADLRRDEGPGQVEMAAVGRDVLPDPGTAVRGLRGGGPPDDATCAGAPDHRGPTPQQLADQGPAEVDVAVGDHRQDPFEGDAADVLAVVGNPDPAGAQRGPGSRGCQVQDLGVRVGDQHPAVDRCQRALVGQADTCV
nr:hypothetical protein [Kineosporia sp. A_224]